MSDESIKVTGLQEVQKKLYAYSQQLGDKVVLGALRQGANYVKKSVIRELANSGVKVRTGKLRKGFAVARSKIHRGKLSTDMIGVYLTLRKGKDAPFYGRFINDGWQAGKTKVAGKHFVQRAFESSKDNAVRLIVRDAEAGADLLARKVGL